MHKLLVWRLLSGSIDKQMHRVCKLPQRQLRLQINRPKPWPHADKLVTRHCRLPCARLRNGARLETVSLQAGETMHPVIRRVPQRYYKLGDCGIACAAMVCGVSYKEAHDAAEKLSLRRNGEYYTSHSDLQRLVRSLGREAKLKRFSRLREVCVPAIVKVNGSRDRSWWHWVVLTESPIGLLAILDPKPGKPARIRSFSGYRGHGNYLRIV